MTAQPEAAQWLLQPVTRRPVSRTRPGPEPPRPEAATIGIISHGASPVAGASTEARA